MEQESDHRAEMVAESGPTDQPVGRWTGFLATDPWSPCPLPGRRCLDTPVVRTVDRGGVTGVRTGRREDRRGEGGRLRTEVPSTRPCPSHAHGQAGQVGAEDRGWLEPEVIDAALACARDAYRILPTTRRARRHKRGPGDVLDRGPIASNASAGQVTLQPGQRHGAAAQIANPQVTASERPKSTFAPHQCPTPAVTTDARGGQHG